MTNPLFSTYRTGENRVTASMLAVFERIDLSMVKDILEGATEMDGELSGVRYENQVSGAESVPDARISARFTWLFETKIVPHEYEREGNRDQVRRHAEHLVGDPDAWLFVLTPDVQRPAWFSHLETVPDNVRRRVVWLSFAGLAAAVEQILAETTRLIDDRTRFLLSELIALFGKEGLLDAHKDTVIVAAGTAWDEYRQYAAYVCQPNRSFQNGTRYFGFYRRGEVMPAVAAVREQLAEVNFSRETADGLIEDGLTMLGGLIHEMLDDQARTEGESYGVFLLSPLDDPRTTHLPAPIRNDTTTATGKPWAWTLGQRYTTLERLLRASVTSEL